MESTSVTADITWIAELEVSADPNVTADVVTIMEHMRTVYYWGLLGCILLAC